MRKSFILLLSLVLMALLAFSACKPAEDTKDTADTDDTADVVEEPVGDEPVPFSELDDSMLDASDDYSEFVFKDGSGDCLDQGLFAEFSYVEVPEGGFVVKSADGSYLEDFASLTFTGNLSFDDVPLTDGPASCSAVSQWQSDDAAVTCSIDEAEVCTGTYKVWAMK